jgi:DNA-binding NtrC family response regulator/tetratricopeptide (TPR) repeat protein
MDGLADLLGRAPQIVQLREQIGQVLARASHAGRLPPILLEGETGTGKNLVAGLIHRRGPRRAGPFVEVNCAAIPEGLLEAELFGFERGAFTDARQPKAGLFQTAHGGTILLDEISLLSDALQAKLLQVIEERSIRRLGSTRNEPVDVSIVAATNEDLPAAVAARRFRADLYHRLAVLTLRLPPLRERGDDVCLLADHLLARSCKDYALPPKTLTMATRAALCAYGWPGNVRELSNVMERVALLVEASHIGPEMLDLPCAASTADIAVSGTPVAAGASLDARVETWERDELRRALEETRWNVARAAARLGITRGTIRYRIDKYGLEPSTRRHRPPPAPVAAAPQPSVPAATRWERRLVALLQARCSPGELGGELGVLVEKIESFGGRIEEAGRSRIVAAFGVDPAEDAPRRAALAAMAIQNALGRERPGPARRRAVALAIHADECPVGDVSGRPCLEVDAKRLMASVLEELGMPADADAIMVSGVARALLGPRFDFDQVDADAEPAHGRRRLLAYHQHRFEAGGRSGPFVGRARELEALRDRWEEARHARGQLVAVVGEPGIGKSRLLYELRHALGGASLTYLEGRGESYGRDMPYRPVVELLKAYFRIDEGDEPALTAEKVTSGLRALDQNLLADLPALLALLDAPGVTDHWRSLDPSERRRRTLDMLRRLVLRMSQTDPVLLVIEDLHWVDAETQAFLDRLVGSLPTARLLVVVSARPEYRHTWAATTSYTQLHLDPLPTPSAEQLARSLVGDDTALHALRRLVIERAEGNPFFLEESVRTLVETRALIGERGAYRAALAIESLQVPVTVRAVLGARVARLLPEERQLLQAAAVVGKDVPLALLQGVADVPETTLRTALASLQAAEFLQETKLFPDIVYTFKHALTHEVAYETLGAERQRALHARMIDALERFYAERLGEQVERLALHALAAETWPKALAYCRQAGAKAAWRSAHREAVRYFDQALGAIERLPQTRATLEETLDLHLQLRWSLVPLGEYGRLAESLRRAATLAEGLDDPVRLGEISQSMTNFLRLVGDCAGALQAGQRARAIGAELGNRTLEVRATYQLGLVHRQLGAYDRAIADLRLVVDALAGELVYERFGEPSVLSVHARAWMATALAEVGRFTEARTVAEESIRIAETAKNDFSLAQAYNGLGQVYLRQGHLVDAERLFERAVSLCREGNFHLLLPIAAGGLGTVFVLSERVEEGLPLLELAVQACVSKGLVGGCAMHQTRLGYGQLLATRAHARETAARALDAARAHGERGHEAWALYVLGEITARDGTADHAMAVRHYGDALTLARALHMQPLIAHCHGRLGRLCRLTERLDEAREHMLRATTMFEEMDMPPALEAAATPPWSSE